VVAHVLWEHGVVSSSLTFPTFLVGLCHGGTEQQGRLAGCQRVTPTGGCRVCVF
jgi:hypothetical protein